MLGQRLQLGLLGRESLGDHALGGAVNADVGHGIEPGDELSVEVVEVAEAAAKKEVLADIAERPLDLSLGLCPIRSGIAGDLSRGSTQGLDAPDNALLAALGHAGYAF